MKHTQYLPTLLIMINIMAAIIYAHSGDYRKFIYWISAAAYNGKYNFLVKIKLAI